MKLSTTAGRILSERYRAVLIKCAILNAAVLIGATIMPTVAGAADVGDETALRSAISRQEGTITFTDNIALTSDLQTTATPITTSTTIDGAGKALNAALHAGIHWKAETGTLTINNITIKNAKYSSTAQNYTGTGLGVYFNAGVGGAGPSPAKTTAVLNIGDGVSFLDNEAYNVAGALKTTSGVVHIGNNVLFQGNRARLSAGAVYLESDTDIGNGLSLIDNSSNSSGGALVFADDNDLGYTTTIGDNATFRGNHAGKNGGAIQFQSQTVTFGNNALFENNTAATNGGAIHLADYSSSSITLPVVTFGQGATFKGNTASAGVGGAIYTQADLTISGATFENNRSVVGDYVSSTYKKQGVGGAIAVNGADLTVANSTFTGNTALSTNNGYGLGGAMSTMTVDGNASSITVSGSAFNANKADVGGALYSMLKGTNQAELSNISVTNSTFTNNEATYGGGAIASFDIFSVSGSIFTGNKTTVVDDGGGVMFLGSESVTSVSNTVFNNNSSAANGGAIAGRSVDVGNNAAAKLDITGSTFTGNTAVGNGGAVFNTFHNSVGTSGSAYIASSGFAGNTAVNGGAVYNSAAGTRDTVGGILTIDNSSFENNIASAAGGAIYNAGIINFTGANSFLSNTANGVANDIHNVGTINFAGTNTLTSGVTGTGNAYVTAGSLDIGTSTFTQTSLNMAPDTVLKAALMGASGNAKLDVGTVSAADATLSLTLSGAGTYDFSTSDLNFANLGNLSNNLYDVTTADNGKTIVATLKQAPVVPSDIPLTPNDKGVLTTLATGLDTTTAHPVVTGVLTGLQSDDPEIVKKSLETLHDIAPVGSNVTSSSGTNIVGQVMGAVGNRIGGQTGAASGDEPWGFNGWIQGLANKSKLKDHGDTTGFDGTTEGFALGFDTVLDKTYTLGFGYSYNHSKIDAETTETKVDSHTIFLYGQYQPAAWFVDGALSVSFNSYSDENPTRRADYDSTVFSAQLRGGYDFAYITPQVGLRYFYIHNPKYTDSLGTTFDSDNSNLLTGLIGFKMSHAFDMDGYRITPEFRAAATYDLVSKNNKTIVSILGAAAYEAEGERLPRFGGEFGIGLSAFANGFDVSLNYDLGLRNHYTSHTGTLKLKYDF